MLEYLRLENVGPASSMEMEVSPRLNLITGNNGLGKSFLLDVAWWALTRKWPAEVNPLASSGLMARPAKNGRAIIDRFWVRWSAFAEMHAGARQ
jgi:DNA repair exonuclease SbcCD ATPase subunit